jgi:hypothetical protein
MWPLISAEEFLCSGPRMTHLLSSGCISDELLPHTLVKIGSAECCSLRTSWRATYPVDHICGVKEGLDVSDVGPSQFRLNWICGIEILPTSRIRAGARVG